MTPAKQRRTLPPLVQILLFLICGFGALYALLGPPPIAQMHLIFTQEMLSIKFLSLSLFMVPSLVFLLGYGMLYERIAGHRPKFIRHDRVTGYHLNKPIVYRFLEGFASVLIIYGFFLGLFFPSKLPPLWVSIVFCLVSTTYFGIRLNYRLQPARDERAAAEFHKAADEARKAYEATPKPQTPPDLAPLLTLAIQGLINQKQVIIGTAPDSVPVYYQGEERFRHTYVIGSTGSGKTTLLCNLIAQDICYRNGLIVLASEKDLFERLLTFIPESRADDLIYFDATDITPPIIGFNPFALAGENQNQKAGETMTILKRAMGGDMGVSMEPIIDNAVSALAGRPQSTFADLIRLIDPSDKTFRNVVKNDPTVDEETRTFWERYDQSTYYRKSHDAVRNRFQPFARQPISTVLAVPSLSFKTHLNTKPYIIFLDLSQLRDTTLVTMGQLLLAAIEQSLLSRDPLDKSLIPYYLYIDEFQKYATDSEKSLIELLNGARKNKLSVTLAHQSIANIPGKLIDTITDNAQTTIALQLPAVENASYFAKKLRIMKPGRDVPDPTTLQDLNPGYGYVQTPTHKIGVKVAMPENPVVPLPIPLQGLKARSKQNFGSEPPNEPVARPDKPDVPKPPQKKKSFGITFE